jgi:hypothetical protein
MLLTPPTSQKSKANAGRLRIDPHQTLIGGFSNGSSLCCRAKLVYYLGRFCPVARHGGDSAFHRNCLVGISLDVEYLNKTGSESMNSEEKSTAFSQK